MKTTKIKIKNLFGISETELDGRSVEITGKNGTGKTSVLDAIRYALTNDSYRDYIIKKGESEGEIIVETDTGLSINRKKRTNKADYKSIKEGHLDVSAPESMLKQLFTPLQLDPVEFTLMDKKSQNRAILDLIDFDWDLEWIKEKFGELPNVNYDQNILQVLNDIQSEKGDYFKHRQDVNRDIRNQEAFITEIAETIPSNYDADKWAAFNLKDVYTEIEKIRQSNSKIERANLFKDSYTNKIRGYEAEKEIAITGEKEKIAQEREQLVSDIERKKAEIKANEQQLTMMDSKLEDKIKIVEEQYNTKVSKLDADMAVADEYVNLPIQDTSNLEDEANTAEEMKKHLNEYNRMQGLQRDVEAKQEESKELTRKIELARNLPGEILETAKLPIENLTIEDGVPLVNGLPVSNLSEGEKLDLCVDVALAKPNNLQIILLDGVEKLSDENRAALYKKCKEKGLQFVATRTTNGNEMEINYL